MRTMLFALALMVSLIAPPVSKAADAVKNPFLTATVGDWAAYTQSMTVGKRAIKSTIKQTVKAKTKENVTISIETQTQLFKVPPQEVKVPLDETFNPVDLIQGSSGLEVNILEEGEETLKAAGKSYPCKWQKVKLKGDISGVPIDTTAKVWISTEAPLGGLVKFEGDVLGNKSVMELTSSGSAKK